MKALPPIELVFVERALWERRTREEVAAVQHAGELGLPVRPVGKSELRRRAVSGATLCVGSVPFVLEAFRAAGVRAPKHNPYPQPLEPWLRRRVGYAPSLSWPFDAEGVPTPVFVKPAKDWKRFRGGVLEDADHARGLAIAQRQPVWWSEVVSFASEWRAYCAEGRVLDLQPVPHSAAGPDVDRMVVEAAVAALAAAGELPRGVVIDFGVLASGETALIEMNDGFAFGAYGTVSAQTCWRVWSERWSELLASSEPVDGPPA